MLCTGTKSLDLSDAEADGVKRSPDPSDAEAGTAKGSLSLSDTDAGLQKEVRIFLTQRRAEKNKVDSVLRRYAWRET